METGCGYPPPIRDIERMMRSRTTIEEPPTWPARWCGTEPVWRWRGCWWGEARPCWAPASSSPSWQPRCPRGERRGRRRRTRWGRSRNGAAGPRWSGTAQRPFRSTLPGRRSWYAPSATWATPFTNTQGIPCGYWWGSAKVAMSGGQDVPSPSTGRIGTGDGHHR